MHCAPALDGVAHAVPLLLGDAVKQLAEDAQREAALQAGGGEHTGVAAASCSRHVPAAGQKPVPEGIRLPLLPEW